MSLYTPGAFVSSERAVAARLVHDHPFATLITPGSPEPSISHLPLLLVATGEPHGTLLGHMARANPHWSRAATAESIAVFHGPHVYVSPSWYEKPAQAVPTWNYATLHAHGRLETIEDPVETRAVLDLLVERFEGDRANPWRFAMPERERDALVAAIVAFRLRVQRIELKLKLSQNRPVADRARVADALEREGHSDAGAVAAWMREYSGLAPQN